MTRGQFLRSCSTPPGVSCRARSGDSRGRRRSKSLAERSFSIALIGGACVLFSTLCFGQEASQGKEPPDSSKPANQAEQSTAPAQPEPQPQKKEKRGSFVAVPIPISSPALGTGIVPVAAYIFPFSRNDKISPPSVVGGGGLFTSNGTQAFFGAGQLYLKENRYRITAAYFSGNLNYDVYGSGILSENKLPLKQDGKLFFGEFMRQVGWKFFVGPRFMTGKSTITLRPSDETDVPPPPEVGIETNLTSLGFKVLRETVPNRFYPTSGTSFQFTGDFFSEALGSKYTFQSYKAIFNKYWSLDKKQVLAYNLYLCGTGGDAPFYGNCIYGANNELRGYTAGRYLTSYMAATQLEYRIALPKRFGLVAFGGVGEVIPGEDQPYGSQRFLPGGGGGIRFLLSKQYHVNLRVDYGIGRDGHTVGMSIGEAF